LVKDWDAETREALRVTASVDGLHAKVGNIDMHELSKSVLDIAHAGLAKRARPGAGGMIPDETHFLYALMESVEAKKTPADELMDHYNGAWAGDINRIFAEFSY